MIFQVRVRVRVWVWVQSDYIENLSIGFGLAECTPSSHHFTETNPITPLLGNRVAWNIKPSSHNILNISGSKTFYWTQFFNPKIFLAPKNLVTLIFLTQFFYKKITWGQIFYPRNIFTPKILLDPKFFLPPNIFGIPKKILTNFF